MSRDVRTYDQDLRSARRALVVCPLLALVTWVVVVLRDGTDGGGARVVVGTLVGFLGFGVTAAGIWTGLRYKGLSASRAASPGRSTGLFVGLTAAGIALIVLGLVVAGGTRSQL